MKNRYSGIELFRSQYVQKYRSQWPRGLRHGSVAARLLRLWVRIPPGAWMFVCCECCVLSGRGLCDELITRPVESYRLWCVAVCDLETSWMMRPWPTEDCWAKKKMYKVSQSHFSRSSCCSTPHVKGLLRHPVYYMTKTQHIQKELNIFNYCGL